jgi:hypothetical protein
LVINLDSAIVNLIIQIIVNIVILAPVLWIAGRLFAGKDKAKFTDALWIVILGTVVGGFFQYLFSGIIASIIVLFIWLALVKHFFDTGWIKAFIIAIVAIVIWIVIAVIIGIIVGVAIITTGTLI